MPTTLITGANRGLGLEFARQYAADGWDVIATCRDPQAATDLRALGPKVAVHRLDVSDFAAIAALGRELADASIDVLIANAGTMNAKPGMRADAIDERAWAADFHTNAMAPLACAAAFLPQVARSSQRKLLAMSSGLGSIGGNTVGGQYAYRSTKAALNAVWHAFAIDHPEAIAVVLSPGALKTDMTRNFGERWDTLPGPAENIAGLRRVIAGFTQADSGGFFNFAGKSLSW